jgi:hypothetical protein
MPRRLFVFLSTLLLIGLYFSFLTSDILTGNPNHPYSRIVKYLCILLCLGLTLAIGRHGHDRRDTWTLRLAFLLTAAADFVIGILGQFVVGIGIFLFVQIVYIVRHARGFVWNKNEIISGLLVFGAIGAIFLYIQKGLREAGLFWPVLIYSLILAASLWLAIGTIWRKFFPRTMDWFIAGGMFLFFLCDANVGLASSLAKDGMTLFYSIFEIQGEVAGPATNPVAIEIPYSLRSIAGILVWLFYLPAQFLLALSGYTVAYLRSVYPLLPDLKEPE